MADGQDVFISYASPNKDVADAVCAALEAAGVKCWIAPRDMISGNYAETIVHTIREARVMVLVLSAEANDSAHVLR
jgi:TIR domain